MSNNEEEKNEQLDEIKQETPPEVKGDIVFPRLGVIIISILLGLIIILAIVIRLLPQ